MMVAEESFAAWVRGLRRRLGLTQGGLGHRVGAAQGAVSDWERGRAVPQEATRRRLMELAEGAGDVPRWLPDWVHHPGGSERAGGGNPTPGSVVAIREDLARLQDRRRALAAARQAALAEVRAVRVRHRHGTAADQARHAAELAPLAARLEEIGRELETVEAAVAELRRG